MLPLRLHTVSGQNPDGQAIDFGYLFPSRRTFRLRADNLIGASTGQDQEPQRAAFDRADTGKPLIERGHLAPWHSGMMRRARGAIAGQLELSSFGEPNNGF